jgi:hypothetical protein
VAARRATFECKRGRGPAGPVGGRRLELAKAASLTWGRGNGFWWSARQTVRRLERWLRQGACGASSPGSRTAENADAGRLSKVRGSPEGRRRWLQRVGVASITSPPKVEDAGNGYSASPRKVRFGCSRSGVGRGIGQGAAGQVTQVAGLGVGTPAGTRDNRSRLQRLVRGIFFGCTISAEAYPSEAAATPVAGSK